MSKFGKKSTIFVKNCELGAKKAKNAKNGQKWAFLMGKSPLKPGDAHTS